MTRAVSVGRSKGLFIIGALGSVLVTMTLAGCPGTLEGNFPAPGGSAGSSGSAGSTGSAGMAMGSAGSTGAAGYPGCDITPLLTKYMCTIGGCHDATGSSANFSMTTAGWQNMLVGVNPKGGGTIPSACTAANLPYVIKSSATGDGLFIQKLKATPPCGLQMPFAMPTNTVSATDLTCFQQFTTALAKQ
jgi:hypothetical protein